MTDEQVTQIAKAIRLISMGENEPAGLEGLAMAISGSGLHNNLCGAISELASANIQAAETIADGLNNIAMAISEKNNDN